MKDESELHLFILHPSSFILQNMGTKVRKCFVPAVSPSQWVYGIYETCNGEIAVWFRHGQRIIARLAQGPGRYISIGGAPSVFCVYPATAGGLTGLGDRLFELSQVWPYAGEFERRFLYKMQPYVIKPPPQGPCGCTVVVSIVSSENPSNLGDAVTFTATVTNQDGSLPPDGHVEFYDGSTDLGAGTPLSQGGNVGTSAFTTASLTVGAHTITAVFTSTTGFLTGQGSLIQVVNGNIGNTCCPSNPFPTTLHVTLTNAGGCACLVGSYAITWNGTSWQYIGTICSSNSLTITFTPGCNLSIVCGGETGTFLPVGSPHCSPLHLGYSQTNSYTVCCTGAVGAQVTT